MFLKAIKIKRSIRHERAGCIEINGLLEKRVYFNKQLGLFFIIVGLGLAYSFAGSTMAGYFFIAASLLACLLFILRIEDPVLRYIILAALVVRVGLAMVQNFTPVDLPGAGADAVSYERVAWRNMQNWLYGIEGGSLSGANMYAGWIAVFYVFFDRIVFIPKLINVYFTLLAIYYLYQTVMLAFDYRKAARVGALIMALLPTLNAYAAVLLRESMIIFVCLFSFYLLLKWIKEARFLYMIYALALLAFGGIFHGAIFLLIWVHLFFVLFYNPQEKRFGLKLAHLLPSLVIIALSMWVYTDILDYSVPANITDIFTPEFFRGQVEGKTTGRASYLLDMVPYTYFDLFWQTPIRVIYFMFMPFPWLIENLTDLFGFVDVALYAVLIIFFVIGAFKVWKKNREAVIIMFLAAVTLVVMFSWGTTNYGTAWRHRQKVAPFLATIAAVGISSSKRWEALLPGEDDFFDGQQTIEVITSRNGDQP